MKNNCAKVHIQTATDSIDNSFDVQTVMPPEIGSFGLGRLYDYVALSTEKTLPQRIDFVLDKLSYVGSSAIDNSEAAFISNGLIKLRILKILTNIGLKTENHIAVLARLIEILANNRNITIENAIGVFAKQCSATESAVNYIIEKSFNIYDPEFVLRVTALTKSNPFTAKDVLCNLAVYVRKYYVMGGLFHA